MDIGPLYLETLKNTLIDLHRGCPREKVYAQVGDFRLVRSKPYSQLKRERGEDWPERAETMIGALRMNNLLWLIKEIIRNNVPGDLIETGVWRGGASIFMKANLVVHGSDKHLYVCDSFEGLPKPTLDEDRGDKHHKIPYLAVPLREVKFNFRKYNLLDDSVHFIKGWFKDTMPTLKEKTFSLLRLDGDMYESTWDVLNHIYPRVSPGGYVAIDDWALKGCRAAVSDYLATHHLTVRMHVIDNCAVYFQKPII